MLAARTEPRVVAAPTVARTGHRSNASRRSLAILAGAALVLAGVGTAAMLAGGDAEPARTVTTVRTVVSDSTSTETVTETSIADEPTQLDDGVALNAEGYELMQDGDYAAALPILERAVAALAGSGEVTEAYASYNLAFTRFALGECDGVLELLERSQEVQGKRREIDQLRREVERACGGTSGKGKGGEDDGDD